jgi:hypothetical protein
MQGLHILSSIFFDEQSHGLATSQGEVHSLADAQVTSLREMTFLAFVLSSFEGKHNRNLKCRIPLETGRLILLMV